MKIDIALTVTAQLETGEEPPPEARVVQQLQDAIAAINRKSPDELAEIWRAALEAQQQIQQHRQRHAHGGRTGRRRRD